MKRILLVSIAFPPKNDPECLQTAKYFKYLGKSNKYQWDVITSKMPTLFMPYDANLESYDCGYQQKVTLPIYQNKYLQFVKRVLSPGSLQLPDPKNRFFRKPLSSLAKLKHRPDILYSRAFPLSSNIFGLMIHKALGIPWVVHLSDPWVDNPSIQWTSEAKMQNMRMQNECFSRADFVTVSSPSLWEFYQNEYGQFRDKFRYLPNIFDDDDLNTKPLELSNKIRVVFTGGLTAERTVLPLLQAFRIFQKKDPILASRYEFTFVGAIDRSNRIIFKQYRELPISHLGFKSYNQAVTLQRNADLLLLIDTPPEDQSPIFFLPSKLMDYIAAKRKILAIANERSVIAKIINENQLGLVCNHQEIPKIVEFLKTIAEEHSLGNKTFFQQEFVVDSFRASTNAKKLCEIFDSL